MVPEQIAQISILMLQLRQKLGLGGEGPSVPQQRLPMQEMRPAVRVHRGGGRTRATTISTAGAATATGVATGFGSGASVRESTASRERTACRAPDDTTDSDRPRDETWMGNADGTGYYRALCDDSVGIFFRSKFRTFNYVFSRWPGVWEFFRAIFDRSFHFNFKVDCRGGRVALLARSEVRGEPRGHRG